MRPRIVKRDGRWQIQLPPYGFQREGAKVGPFRSQRAAIRYLGTRGGASAAQHIEREW